MEKKLKINISPDVIAQMNVLSSEYSFEMAGYLVGHVTNGRLHVTELLLPEQDTGYTSVRISSSGQVELRKKYGDKVKNIIGHWHSHAAMGVFWSDVDHENMNNIIENKNFYVFVVSSRGKHLIKVCVRSPFSFDIDTVDFYLTNPCVDEVREFANKISEEHPIASSLDMQEMLDEVDNEGEFSSEDEEDDEDDSDADTFWRRG